MGGGEPGRERGALGSFVPRALLARVLGDEAAGREGVELDGATLFVDITGFTLLAEALSSDRLAGAERLSELCNRLFGEVIDRIVSAGGEVISMPGDAVSALWASGAPHEPLAASVQRAAACALAIQRWSEHERPASLASLRLRIGVGAGPLWARCIGREQRAFVVGGHEMIEGARAAAAVDPGGCGMTEAAVRELGARGVTRAAGRAFALLEAESAAAPLPAPSRTLDMAATRKFLPRSIVEMVDAGHDDWLAELRPTTVAFIGLRGNEGAVAPDPVRACEAVTLAQCEIARFGGSLNQVACDDKGLALLGVWGVVDAARANDAHSAIAAVLHIFAALAPLRLGIAVGIASGRAFCGVRGSVARREYAVIGDCVALAARLMQAAPGGVLADEATAALAPGRLRLSAKGPLALKGRSAEVPVYEPLERSEPFTPHVGGAPLVGREREWAILGAALQTAAAHDDERQPVVMIEGEAGIGKSALLAECERRASEMGITVLAGAGDATEGMAAYFAWRPVMRALLAGDPVDEPTASVASRARRWLTALHEEERLPLLAELLGVDIPDDDRTRQLAGLSRVEASCELATRLFRAALGARKGLLIIDDAHWLDSASWALLRSIQVSLPCLLIVIGTRPRRLDDLPRAARELLRETDRITVGLGPLPPSDVSAMIGAALDVDDVAPQVTDVVRERAAGNPLLTQQLALVLRDCGFLSISGRRCRISASTLDLATLDLPRTLDEIVAKRLEGLPAHQVLTLKVASALAFGFHMDAMSVLLPVERTPEDLRGDVEALVERQLLTVQATPEGPRYVLGHALTRDAIYARLPLSQRRSLHGRIGAWLESSPAADDTLLAYHWFQADEPKKACAYAAQAASHALRLGASREAAELYRRALALLDDQRVAIGATVPTAREADWNCGLGIALYGVGDLSGARDRLGRAIDILGRRTPRSAVHWTATLVRELLAQVALRTVWPVRRAPRKATELATVAIAAQRLSEVFLWSRASVPMLTCTLLSVNSAERAQRTEGSARSYAMLAFSLGVSGLHALARSYFARALRTAEGHGDLPGRVFIGYARCVYMLGVGDWQASRASAREAMSAATDLADPQESEMVETALANLEYYTGAVEAAGQRYRALWASGRQRANAQHEAWGLYGEARSLIVLGRRDIAEQRVRQALHIFNEVTEEISELICHGLLAELCMERGDREAALAEARATMKLIRRAPPTVVTVLQGYAGAAKVFTAYAGASAGPGEEARRLLREAAEAVRQLRTYAMFFPIGRPRSHLSRGSFALVSGRRDQAVRAFRRSLREAERLEMPYERALAHQHLALATDSPERETHRSSMRSLLDSMDAPEPGASA